MKFRCERDVLVEALATAQRATSSRATLPVLSGLRLALTGDELRLTGSDLDLTITTEVKVSGEDDGVAARARPRMQRLATSRQRNRQTVRAAMTARPKPPRRCGC